MTIDDKSQIIKLLSQSGATIQELNTVRKSISRVKGGKLASMAAPATIAAMILSDVINDPLDMIAGGPTIRIDNNISEASEIISKYNLIDQMPATMTEVLQNNPPWEYANDTGNVFNFLIGNNTLAAETAASKAEDLGYETIVLNTALDGEAKVVGRKISRLIHILGNAFEGHDLEIAHLKNLQIIAEDRIQNLLTSVKTAAEGGGQGLCLIFGGETIVKVIGDGIGGRNQELTLSCAIDADRFPSDGRDWILLSAGTDGIDGPTDAAGALTYRGQMDDARKSGMTNVVEYLENNDSNRFYKLLNGGEYLVVTGHTGTNVMDLIIVVMATDN